jgi:hypothetical protein
MQVSLRNVVLSLNQPVTVSGQENTPTLALLFWFYDECFSFFLIELFFKGFTILWEDPCLWEEVKFLGHHVLHIL